jgi:hypothetical protein
MIQTYTVEKDGSLVCSKCGEPLGVLRVAPERGASEEAPRAFWVLDLLTERGANGELHEERCKCTASPWAHAPDPFVPAFGP